MLIMMKSNVIAFSIAKTQSSLQWRSVILICCTILLNGLGSSEAVFNPGLYLKLKQLSKESLTKENAAERICETPTCITTATSILENMDPTVHPCDDFYNFACGNFLKNTVIPDDAAQINSFASLNDKLKEQLRISIENNIKDTDPRSFQLLKSYYNICMDEGEGITNNQKEYLKYIKEFGGWPVLDEDNWNEKDFDWKKLMYQFRQKGYSNNQLIALSIDVDVENNTKNMISLSEASVGLSNQDLKNGFEDKIVQNYYQYMVNFVLILGANKERAEKEFKDSLEFEINLVKISPSQEDQRNITALYNPMTVKELQSKYSTIPWIEYLNEILKPDVTIDENEVILVTSPSFLSDLENLLKTTPKRVLANYLIWRISQYSAYYLGGKFEDVRVKYESNRSGKTEQNDRWKDCLDILSDKLDIGISALYVRKYFDNETKYAAQDMINNIQQSYKNILTNIDWMDKGTKEAALEKLDMVESYIGYPDELLDDKKIDNYYENFEVDNSSYLVTDLNFNLFTKSKIFKSLKEPFNKKDWTAHSNAAVVNAYYDPLENSIQFPAGILQGIFFDMNRPKYMNYGAIGCIMGHEMTHGFDDLGSQFDKNGNLVDWWQKDTKEKYLQKAKCIIEQYNNYTVEDIGLHINGINTQGENIADNGGMKEAYFAYQEWEKKNGVEPQLPKLNYTSQQMFWISIANVYCEKVRPQLAKILIDNDVHSPGKYRIIGSMSNIPEFSKDFNCPINSKMNPVNKCTVW